MTGYYKWRYQRFVRLCTPYSLIFFMAGLLTGCHSTDKTATTIQWNDNRATGILIPSRFTQSIPDDSLPQLLTIRLPNEQTAIAGQYRQTGDAILFEPVIPFTRGMRYAVWIRTKRLAEISIPTLPTGDNPALLVIYPSGDSLPENLLKIYLRFSRPMREGQSEKYVTIVKNGIDTLPGVFLNLQPELWNADRTLLTLWLDPGRVKRDLQPNKLLGAPLQADDHYQLIISPYWPDQQGAVLAKTTTKPFVTTQRDSLSPNPKRWDIHEPTAEGRQPLNVSFGEALDYSLLTETFQVMDANGQSIAGTWQIGKEEKQSHFTPAVPWKRGRYTFRIEARLEDLAGNNLNRPFDRDITHKSQTTTNGPFKDLFFEVR